MTIRITDAAGRRPKFTQWDVDRELLISGCETKLYVYFENGMLTRALSVEAEANGTGWKCKVPNFILQFNCDMVVTVFAQTTNGEGKTVLRERFGIQPRKKPQDYTYEENIGYVNWVEKSEEAQELLDDIEDLRDEIQTAVDTATSASEAAVAAAEDIDETVAAALQAAKDSGDFDGADGQDGQDGAPGPKGDAGEDGVSPRFSSTSITGGHRITVQDAYGDYTFDVMDGSPGPQGETGPQGPKGDTGAKGDKGDDGEDATIDATLSNAGEAADAAETGKVKHTADYARLYAETLNSGAALPLDAEWELYDISGSRAYRIHTSDRIVAAAAMELQIASGYRFYVRTYSGGSHTDSSWYGPAYSSRKTYTIAAGTDFSVVISAYPEDSSVVLTDEDVAVYAAQISIKNNISSGGGGGGSVSPYTSNPAALGTASPGSSDNYARGDHVHPKPTAADIGAGTYSKPSGGIPYSDLSSSVQISLDAADAAYQFPANGIPASDLASAVQTSLGKADTALQSAPVTSVNNQTGAVSLPIPSTASDVGAVAVAQGVAHAGEFVVVGSDGNITTVTMSVWQGGSF